METDCCACGWWWSNRGLSQLVWCLCLKRRLYVTGEGNKLPFPSGSDLNTRLRRVITGYQRNHKKMMMKHEQVARVSHSPAPFFSLETRMNVSEDVILCFLSSQCRKYQSNICEKQDVIENVSLIQVIDPKLGNKAPAQFLFFSPEIIDLKFCYLLLL